MAKDTNINLRNQMIYQVFPRQYSNKSNFEGVIEDLNRIKALGTNILYLLPIHPIGQKNKKGSLGCPYSIKDYREVCPDLGTIDDFKRLIEATHSLGMKIMIDVVYNHTSRDSKILTEHPDWMYKDKNGNFAGKVGDWWDVTDLDFTSLELQKELIDTLCYWVSIGVDGFRCDVASIIPLEFWIKARAEIKKINPEVIMMAESVHLSFVKSLREDGYICHSDSEVYEAFDIEYCYDIWDDFMDYVKTGEGLNVWLKGVSEQEARYPLNFVKMHCLENHDQGRIRKYIRGSRLYNLTALIFFLKGITMIYNGQEAEDKSLPSLFDIDLVNWDGLAKSKLPSLISRCSMVKKNEIFQSSRYKIIFESKNIVHLKYENENAICECIFNLSTKKTTVKSVLSDGIYINILEDSEVVINNSLIGIGLEPVVIIKNKEE